MVLRKTGLLSIVVASFLCVGVARAQGTSCATTPVATMIPFDTAKVATLVGTYDVVMVDTTSLRGSVRQHAGKLVLWMTDTVPKRRANMARGVERKFMIGTFTVAKPDSGDMWDTMVSRETEAPGVFWSNGFLRLGEFGPKSGISLYVRLTADGELRGMWTSHPGTIIVDFTGEREPDEAGYFCAKRVK